MKELFTRRSVRKYLDTKVKDEDVQKLLKAAMYAPSAINEQPWEFIVVDDKNIIQDLGSVNTRSTFISTVPLLIIVLGNKNKCKCPMYNQDLAASTQNILLEARHLGLGTCWIGVNSAPERIENIRNYFNLPEHIEPFSMITVGYPENEDAFFDANRENKEVVHKNGW